MLIRERSVRINCDERRGWKMELQQVVALYMLCDEGVVGC